MSKRGRPKSQVHGKRRTLTYISDDTWEAWRQASRESEVSLSRWIIDACNARIADGKRHKVQGLTNQQANTIAQLEQWLAERS